KRDWSSDVCSSDLDRGSGRRNDQKSRSFDQFRSSPGSDTDPLAQARPIVSIATEPSATMTTNLFRGEPIRIFERLVICQIPWLAEINRSTPLLQDTFSGVTTHHQLFPEFLQ